MDLPEFRLIDSDGKRHWLHLASGRILPYVAGGAEGDPPEPKDPPEPDADKDKDPPKTFTQAELDKILAREKAATERTTKKTIQDYLDAQKADADKATMDEATRAKAEADEAKAEGERIKAEAARERLEAKVERALARAGVAESAVAKAVRLIDLDVDADGDAITAEVEALKKDVPGLFGTVSGDGKAGGAAPSGVTGTKPPPSGQGTKTALEKGKERWASKHGKKTTDAA